MKRIIYASITIVSLFFASSCRHIIIVNSRVEIVSQSIDEALIDSALIYGTVFFGEDEEVPMSNAKIWIEGSNVKTISDNMGHFSLKILPGIYTIKCLGDQYEEKFTIVLSNISLSLHEKIEIKFFHGYIGE